MKRLAKLVCTCRPDDTELCPCCEEADEDERQYERYIERAYVCYDLFGKDEHDERL